MEISQTIKNSKLWSKWRLYISAQKPIRCWFVTRNGSVDAPGDFYRFHQLMKRHNFCPLQLNHLSFSIGSLLPCKIIEQKMIYSVFIRSKK